MLVFVVLQADPQNEAARRSCGGVVELGCYWRALTPLPTPAAAASAAMVMLAVERAEAAEAEAILNVSNRDGQIQSSREVASEEIGEVRTDRRRRRNALPAYPCDVVE
jgi:hypothetical protein